MSEKGKIFGTDGMRGTANEWPVTSEMALSVGRAVAHILQKNPALCGKSSLPVGLKPLNARKGMRRAKIVIGKDTRLSGYMIENALVSGVCSMGADAMVIGPLPTPGVSFVTQSMRADAGIMISASHNAFQDNGIKLFSASGFKFPDATEEEIERLIGSPELDKQRPAHDLIGKAFRIDDAIGRYLVFLKSLFPKSLDLEGLRLVVDCANGAAYKVAPLVFEELGAEVIRIGVEPNGLNINSKCGALHPDNVANATIKYRADLGISLDGDGDRCILADENGNVVDGDQIIGLCALEMAKEGRLHKNTIVTTPMSNMGLEKTLQAAGVKMLRAKVGDRYVVETMRNEGLNLGGEQSGHLIFLDHFTTGDGIVAALKVLEIMRRNGKYLSELKKQITLFPQVHENVKVSRKVPLEDLKQVRQAISEVEKDLKNSGRVVVRYSGTEPLARILVEGPDETVLRQYSRKIATSIQREIG